MPRKDEKTMRKPRTRLSKWLAKIAGVYDGEMEPKTEAEYYLNEIAQNGSGGSGAFVINATAGVFDTPVSYNDIRAAVDAGRIVLMLNTKSPDNTSIWYLSTMRIEGEVETPYNVEFNNGDITYAATSAETPLMLAE